MLFTCYWCKVRLLHLRAGMGQILGLSGNVRACSCANCFFLRAQLLCTGLMEVCPAEWTQRNAEGRQRVLQLSRDILAHQKAITEQKHTPVRAVLSHQYT